MCDLRVCDPSFDLPWNCLKRDTLQGEEAGRRIDTLCRLHPLSGM